MTAKQNEKRSAGRAPKTPYRIKRVYVGTRQAEEIVADLMKVHAK